MAEPAILGGTPVRTQRYIAYPRWTEEEKEALCKVVDDRILSMFYGWKQSHKLEEEFAAFHGMKYAVAVSSGTAALHCAYSVIGIGAGDEVIVPANAFISAATAALQLNVIPVFADIDPNTVVLDPKVLERYITPRTRAVVPVHLYGNPVDMEALCAIARRYNLVVVEDCAQAHGATINGRKSGSPDQDWREYGREQPQLRSTPRSGTVPLRTWRRFLGLEPHQRRGCAVPF